MAVTVLIKRNVSSKNESLLEELYREMRSAALNQERIDSLTCSETKFEIYIH